MSPGFHLKLLQASLEENISNHSPMFPPGADYAKTKNKKLMIKVHPTLKKMSHHDRVSRKHTADVDSLGVQVLG